MLLYGVIWLMVGMLITGLGLDATAQSTPEGQLTIAFDTSIASTYLDPAETTGIATPFVFLYGLHDALIKPPPGSNMAACLAESWRESEDGLTYEFQLRAGSIFHNGDPFAALEFPEQWDAKSPWHDRRVRLAANLAIDKQAINEVERMGLGRPTGSIIPRSFEFALPLEPFPYDPDQARQLLAEAG